MKNVFNQTDANEIIDRINKLTTGTKALWGKMNVAQMPETAVLSKVKSSK